VSMAQYRATYAAKLYPYLRPDQRVVLLPWAADCEEGCRAHAAIAPAPDMRVLPNAHDHWAWAQDDHKVVGLFVYRLKNIWQQAGTSTTWGGAVAKSQKTLVLCRPRRRSPCPRSAIRACFSTGGTSRGLGGVPNVQRSRNFMGALDAHAHRAASAAQTAARMVNGSRDNVCVVGLPLLHDDSMCTWCGRNILLPRRPRARRLAD